MLDDFAIGPVRIRIDFPLLVVGVGLVSDWPLAAGFGVAILLHELGHGLGLRLVGQPFRLLLHVGGGGSYVHRLESVRARSIVLASGVVLGFLPSLLAQLVLTPPWRGSVTYAAVVWTVFQVSPFPPLDGGLLLRQFLARRLGSATLAWRLGWVLGFAFAIILVTVDFRMLVPVVYLTGMTVILGRTEAGYVRHLDAFEAWERGEYRGVIDQVKAVPEYLGPSDARALVGLGLAAALQLEDVATVEDFAAKLPAHDPNVVGAAEWLLARAAPYGAKLADHALDALDAERVKADQIDRPRWADLCFRYAIFEAIELRPESALGLLERAIGFGFDDLDRLDAEGNFDRIRSNPRWSAVVACIRT